MDEPARDVGGAQRQDRHQGVGLHPRDAPRAPGPPEGRAPSHGPGQPQQHAALAGREAQLLAHEVLEAREAQSHEVALLEDHEQQRRQLCQEPLLEVHRRLQPAVEREGIGLREPRHQGLDDPRQLTGPRVRARRQRKIDSRRPSARPSDAPRPLDGREHCRPLLVAGLERQGRERLGGHELHGLPDRQRLATDPPCELVALPPAPPRTARGLQHHVLGRLFFFFCCCFFLACRARRARHRGWQHRAQVHDPQLARKRGS